MSDLQFVVNHDELQHFLNSIPKEGDATKKAHFEVGFDASSGAIVPTLKISAMHFHTDGTTTKSTSSLFTCPNPPGHC